MKTIINTITTGFVEAKYERNAKINLRGFKPFHSDVGSQSVSVQC